MLPAYGTIERAHHILDTLVGRPAHKRDGAIFAVIVSRQHPLVGDHRTQHGRLPGARRPTDRNHPDLLTQPAEGVQCAALRFVQGVCAAIDVWLVEVCGLIDHGHVPDRHLRRCHAACLDSRTVSSGAYELLQCADGRRIGDRFIHVGERTCCIARLSRHRNPLPRDRRHSRLNPIRLNAGEQGKTGVDITAQIGALAQRREK